MSANCGRSIRIQPRICGIAIPMMVHFLPKAPMKNPAAKQPTRQPRVAREPIQLPWAAV